MSGTPTDRLLELLDELLDVRSAAPRRRTPPSPPFPSRCAWLWYLSWLDFEVGQGSLNAYLMNSQSFEAVPAP